MPIYEYRCEACGRRFTVYQLNIVGGAEEEVHCPRCGSTQVVRRFSRVAVLKSEEARLESLADSAMLEGLDESDPRSLGRFMRKMKEELGSEMAEDLGPEFDEVIDRLEAGQSPEEIEKEMPEFAGEEGGEEGGMTEGAEKGEGE